MEEKVWKVAYEGIHLVCFSCGHYGHRQESCPTVPIDAAQVAATDQEIAQGLDIDKIHPAVPVVGESFGSGVPEGKALWLVDDRSRYAPLDDEDTSDGHPVTNNAEALAPSKENHSARGNSGVTNQKQNSRRANVIVNEKQIVISTTRVLTGEHNAEALGVESNSPSGHHGDPPDAFDEEGDVVMDVEHQQEHGLMEGGARAGGRAFHRVLKNLIRAHKPAILGLVEPKVSGLKQIPSAKSWVRDSIQSPWFFAVVYGNPTHHLCRRLWSELTMSTQRFSGPYLVAGDFNSIVSHDETNNYSACSSQRSSEFVEWIRSEGLIDMGYIGPKFTWSRGDSAGNAKSARLDRALCSLVHKQDSHDVVYSTWNITRDFSDNIARMQTALISWNKNVFGNIHHRKRHILALLGGVQRRLSISYHGGLAKHERKLMGEYHDILHQEELLWFQRSREDWIASGDRNTAYYHAATTIRKNLCFEGEFPLLTQDDWHGFNMAPTKEEVHAALSDMTPFKALGPNGFHAAFYQRMWGVMGDSLFTLVKNAFESGTLPEGLNDTLVALIPKVNNPETVKQFRPISLCNVSYKLIRKTITNRLKGLLPKIVGPFQSSFVLGRQISDNMLIYQEAMHTMRTKKGRCGYMAIKLDLEKVYDRLSWNFIEITLKDIGFSPSWVTLLMNCIRSPRMSIIWNGDRLQQFCPQRGVRQGDAMSPTIFVLCLEKLSQMISLKVESGDWKGIRLSLESLILSHLCFVDDMVLFSEAFIDQVETIRDSLHRFCEASGQKISLAKSQIFFSKNVNPDLANDIASSLQVARTDDLGNYLGVPSFHGRVTFQTFTKLIEQINGRLEGWKTKMLSMAGRVTLAKSVLNTIPTYTMQTSVLPISVCLDIEKRIRRFIWGSEGPENRNKLNLVKWDVITSPKVSRGLGIFKLQDLNNAYMAKLGWRLHNERDSLWARIMATKYANPGRRQAPSRGHANVSNAWKGMLAARHIVKKGKICLVRNGKTTKFWMDKWIDSHPLRVYLCSQLSLPELYATADEYWDDGHDWKWDKLLDAEAWGVLQGLRIAH
ncbi:uncharacterized protein LOC116007017 [Ipomoea triloba]|uniref:uncharacterized protein LOC116007017 n=1 Tax=Ipomoea triloba TaxID=35885 RepID=UPI00125E4F56|nr:uncharacterized protein LOC116007017 [Ipomoea triloba]